jgi:hypothetical protein
MYITYVDLKAVIQRTTTFSPEFEHIIPYAIRAKVQTCETFYPFNLSIHSGPAMEVKPASKQARAYGAQDYENLRSNSRSKAGKTTQHLSGNDSVCWNDRNVFPDCNDSKQTIKHTVLTKSSAGNDPITIYTLPNDPYTNADYSQWANIPPSRFMNDLTHCKYPAIKWRAKLNNNTLVDVDCYKFDINDDYNNNFPVWCWIRNRALAIKLLQNEDVSDLSIEHLFAGNYEGAEGATNSDAAYMYIPKAALHFIVGTYYKQFNFNALVMPVSKTDRLKVSLQPFGNYGVFNQKIIPFMYIEFEMYFDVLNKEAWDPHPMRDQEKDYTFFTECERRGFVLNARSTKKNSSKAAADEDE